jgi:hypothetical protein
MEAFRLHPSQAAWFKLRPRGFNTSGFGQPSAVWTTVFPSMALHAGYSRILRSPLRGASRSHHVDVEEDKRAELYFFSLFYLPPTLVFRKRRRPSKSAWFKLRPRGRSRLAEVSAGCANFRKRAPRTARASHENST